MSCPIIDASGIGLSTVSEHMLFSIQKEEPKKETKKKTFYKTNMIEQRKILRETQMLQMQTQSTWLKKNWNYCMMKKSRELSFVPMLDGMSMVREARNTS